MSRAIANAGSTNTGSARSRLDPLRERLASAVAALENIRLDLLRLDAGVGSPDDLTAHLEHVRALGAVVDTELAARREVSEILAEPRR